MKKTDRPGDRLKAIVTVKRKGCRCKDAIALMNRWGTEKSRKNYKRLHAMLTHRGSMTAQRATWALNRVLYG